MTLPNKQRNELTVILGDKTYLVKPTFNFIAQIEDYFDEPLTEIVLGKLQTGRIKVSEIATIIAAGIEGAGGTPDLEEIKEAIADAGTIVAIDAIAQLLTNSFSGPKINTKSTDKKK